MGSQAEGAQSSSTPGFRIPDAEEVAAGRGEPFGLLDRTRYIYGTDTRKDGFFFGANQTPHTGVRLQNVGDDTLLRLAHASAALSRSVVDGSIKIDIFIPQLRNAIERLKPRASRVRYVNCAMATAIILKQAGLLKRVSMFADLNARRFYAQHPEAEVVHYAAVQPKNPSLDIRATTRKPLERSKTICDAAGWEVVVPNDSHIAEIRQLAEAKR